MALSYDVLKIPDFRRLLATRLAGTFALQAQAVIVGWQIYSLTGDPLMLGLIGLAEALPAIGAALFAGHIVDKSRPYHVFRLCVAGLFANMLFLFLLGGGIIEAPGGNLVLWLFVGVFFSGLIRSFIIPSSFTLQTQIVPRHQMPAAAAWISSCFQFASVSGPAIAGLVYGGYGVTIAWMLPVSLMFIEFIIVCGFSKKYHDFKNHDSREPVMKSIAAGWRFVTTSPVLLPVMALDMFAVLFGGAVAILPMFADQILHTGSEGLGLLRAAPAAGSILTALYFALKPMPIIRGSRLIIVVFGFGFAMIGFALSKSFAVAAFFLALSGAFDSVSMVIRGTLMQLLIPDHMRGRVSALNSMFIISSNEIGAFESGVAAKLMGLVPSLLFGGGMTLLVGSVTALFCPELRKLAIDPRTHKIVTEKTASS